MKKNWKNLPYQEKKRAEQSAVYARRGGLKTATRRSFRPRYFSQRIWDNLNSYWGSDLFKKRSDNAKKARAQVEHIHHSGAKPFSQRREVYYLSCVPLMHFIYYEFTCSFNSKNCLYLVSCNMSNFTI